ncbi:MAG TPA: AEC family transporter, partial [Candidatus Methylacidiphilales bacterium]|nr:AEC family transporter [Candidatus Methylacidiphilales bacterium]
MPLDPAAVSPENSMQFLQVVFAAIIPLLLLLTLGFVLRRAGWLVVETEASLMRVNINVMFPALILDSLLGNLAVAQRGNVILAPTLGFLTIALGLGVGLLAGRMQGMDDTARRSFAFTTGLFNYGYFPIPLITLLFPLERNTLGVLFLFNLGVEICFWTLALMLLRGATWKECVSHLLSAPVIAIVASVAITIMGGGAYVPDAIRNTLKMLGGCAVPVALLVIGGTIADFLPQMKVNRAIGEVVWACGVRLLLLPIVFVATALWLPCSMELKRVLIVQAAMPAAIMPVVLVKLHD